MRSGGLGDFVVTLPLLAALRQAGVRVTLVTRPSYWELIRDDGLADSFLSVDDPALARRDASRLRPLVAGARALCALPDRDRALATLLCEAGAAAVIPLQPRPQAPPHVAVRMLLDAGLPAPPEALERSPLERRAAPDASTLFVHPGSGSPSKNAPLAFFEAQARGWRGPVVVTLGEADVALIEPCRRRLGGAALWIEPSLPALRARLEREAARLVGNDTGPTHLAAALGVPTTAVFVASDPDVWRPVGREVRVLRWRGRRVRA